MSKMFYVFSSNSCIDTVIIMPFNHPLLALHPIQVRLGLVNISLGATGKHMVGVNYMAKTELHIAYLEPPFSLKCSSNNVILV